jgi:hypothetical protein
LRIERTVDKRFVGKYYLDITTKDNRTIKFFVKDENLKLFNFLVIYSNPKDPNLYYKFAYKYKLNCSKNYSSWEIYDPIEEFKRQGVDLEDSVLLFD